MTTGVLTGGVTGIQEVASTIYNTVQQAMPTKELLQHSVAWVASNMPEAVADAGIVIDFNSTAVIGGFAAGGVGGLFVTGLAAYGLYRCIKKSCADDSALIRDSGGSALARKQNEKTPSEIPDSYDDPNTVNTGSETDQLLVQPGQSAEQTAHIVVPLDRHSSTSGTENGGGQQQLHEGNDYTVANSGSDNDEW